jgi:hypothetical protein
MVSKCSSGCPTQDHSSWGECVRSKGLHIGQVDATEQRLWDRELDLYKSARSQGVQPAGTTTTKIREALDISDVTGKAYDASDPIKSTIGEIPTEL